MDRLITDVAKEM